MEGTILEEDHIEYDTEKIYVVDITEVSPNSWNPKDDDTEEYQRVKASVRKNGLRIPIVVRENPNATDQKFPKYEIIDGEQRFNACQELGFQKVLIYNEGEVSDQRARELTIWYQQQVPFNEKELAKLIAEMTGKWEDVSTPFTEAELNDFMKGVKVNISSMTKTPFPHLPGMNIENQLVTFSVVVTREQLEVIDHALTKCIDETDGQASKSKALELIMADYLSG